MKKNLIITLLIAFSFNSYSQIKFEKGYIIQNNGKKEFCLIKNMDWIDNPSKIEYKLSDMDKVKTATLNNIQEFGIDNYSKYKRFTVDIDRSSENLKLMSTKRNPDFKQETLLLKILVEGNTSLYQYIDGNLERYFFNTTNQPIKQLIFKSYLISNKKIGKNENYKQTLINNLKCSDISSDKVKKLTYKQKELITVFVKYNQCKNSNYINFGEKYKKDKKKLFNFSVRLGLNRSSLLLKRSIQSSTSFPRDVSFDNELGFRIGVETEFILPFNKNKWGIILEPTYQYFKSQKATEDIFVYEGKFIKDPNYNVNYKSIEIPIGIRHYFFLKKNSKLFVNASIIIDLPSNSTIELNREDGSNFMSLKIKTAYNLAFGFGYNYNKYSLELRVQTPRDLFNDYFAWTSNYNTTSVIIGYNLF